ncbi:hypothetical protein WMY93_013505 [Mugilogobius chulae]|uniref:Synaptotagmin-7 n=1 Tax=Mugilogobius chulae TaxID=88201 RepID=A0AAW0P3M6_9GOBI
MGEETEAGTVSLSVFLVSVVFVLCAVWLVALCGVCTWCQRKLGKRNLPGVEAASSPESVRGRGENKAINDLDRDFWNNNDSSNVQQRWSSYPPKEFLLNMSPYAPTETPASPPKKGGQAGPSDGGGGACSGTGAGPSRSDSVRSMVTGGSRAGRWQTVQSHLHAGGLRLSNFGDASLSSASTLEHIPSSAVARPRPLVRQQSLQQPLTHQPLRAPTTPQLLHRAWVSCTRAQAVEGIGEALEGRPGNKPGSSPRGQTPDEAGRRQGQEGNSSGNDLANSVTSDMLMLSPGSEEDEHEGPVVEKLGRIQFSVGYSFQDSTLTVKILKGQDLPAKDFSGTSDPFVKLYLLPDKKHKLETKVKRKNLNPHWNETFLFEGFPYEKVVQRTLYLQVLDYDRFSRNDPIGEVSIPLNKLDLANMQTFWKELKPCSDGSSNRGDLLVSLCYNPTANTITVSIIKARNLKAMDIGGTSDPYVKVWLMHKDKRVEKKKTVVMKRCLNPVFNESFPFDVPAHVLRETTIIITVMDKDKLSRNDVIGKIYLSWKSGPAEVKHWKDMMGHPRTAVAQWHALKA